MKCIDCSKNVVVKDGGDIAVPSTTCPVYVCMGRVKLKCTHLFCHKRFQAKSMRHIGRTNVRHSIGGQLQHNS